jgi:hypothetical protein
MALKRVALVLGIVLAGSLLFAADSKKPDARVSKTLDKVGLKYTTTSSANYSIVMDLDDDRSQTVYVMSTTETYGGLEIREIWSNAGTFEYEPGIEEMLQLLEDNNSEKIGGWCLESQDDGSYLAYFAIKVPTYLKDGDFQDMVEFTAKVADEMELSLFDTDDN